MRTLVITQNITLDGSVEMLDDWFDPAGQDPELLDVTRLQSTRTDALLLGPERSRTSAPLGPSGAAIPPGSPKS